VQHIRNKIDLYLGYLIGGIMAAMVLNVLWQVFTRFVLQDPSSFTDELARYMLIWLGLFGAAYASGRSMHLSVDLLQLSVSKSMNIKIDAFIRVCVGLFALSVMVIGGIRLVYITYTLNQTSASLQIPLAWVYLAVPLSGLIILFYSVSGPLTNNIHSGNPDGER